MTDEEKMDLLETLTEETNRETLSAYLSLAKDAVMRKAYPFDDGTAEFPSRYDTVHVEIAAFMLNRRGAEGETVHLENGVSRHYEDGDIPQTLLRRITPMAEVL